MSTVTASVLLTNGPALIQNISGDFIFVSNSNPATTSNGIQIESGQAVAVGESTNGFYGVSTGSSVVRVLERATGLFAVSTA